jgi:hypothetical protein
MAVIFFCGVTIFFLSVCEKDFGKGILFKKIPFLWKKKIAKIIFLKHHQIWPNIT